ncbi:MAG: LysE family transporter [Proteobacteria bacterium]|nr:LysE family transporter [Pseudomonadota bacterium]
MQLQWWVAYVTTILILMSTPGPSHILMLSNSLTHGYKRSLATLAGDLSANMLQMGVATAGLVTVIQSSRSFFVYVKWGGVAYLVYLGIRLFLKSGPMLNQDQSSGAGRSGQALYWQGFLTSATNPKAIIFFAALFPQFLIPTQPMAMQFVMLSATYLFLDGCFLLFYGGFARVIAGFFRNRSTSCLNRTSGTLLIIAASILGLKDMSPDAG